MPLWDASGYLEQAIPSRPIQSGAEPPHSMGPQDLLSLPPRPRLLRFNWFFVFLRGRNRQHLLAGLGCPAVAFSQTASGSSRGQEWPASPGIGYRVEYSASLSPGCWAPLMNVVANLGSVSGCTDPNTAGVGNRFNRIIAVP